MLAFLNVNGRHWVTNALSRCKDVGSRRCDGLIGIPCNLRLLSNNGIPLLTIQNRLGSLWIGGLNAFSDSLGRVVLTYFNISSSLGHFHRVLLTDNILILNYWLVLLRNRRGILQIRIWYLRLRLKLDEVSALSATLQMLQLSGCFYCVVWVYALICCWVKWALHWKVPISYIRFGPWFGSLHYLRHTWRYSAFCFLHSGFLSALWTSKCVETFVNKVSLFCFYQLWTVVWKITYWSVMQGVWYSLAGGVLVLVCNWLSVSILILLYFLNLPKTCVYSTCNSLACTTGSSVDDLSVYLYFFRKIDLLAGVAFKVIVVISGCILIYVGFFNHTTGQIQIVFRSC